jgi:hypothetical protein
LAFAEDVDERFAVQTQLHRSAQHRLSNGGAFVTSRFALPFIGLTSHRLRRLTLYLLD